MAFKVITVTIENLVLKRFRYTDASGKEYAIQKAVEALFEEYLGPDCDPWPYIKGI